MTDDVTGTPKVNPFIEDVVAEMERAANSEYVQLTVSKITPSIPSAVRNGIYTAGIWLGLIGTVAPIVVAFLTGDAQIVAASAGAFALGLTNLLARLNLSKSAEDVARERG